MHAEPTEAADRSFAEYHDTLMALAGASPPHDRPPPNRFRREPASDAWVGLPFAGCTLLAEPYPLQERREPDDGGPGLTAVQQYLAAEYRDFAPVPADTLHMTIADLVSGESFTRRAAAQPGLLDPVKVLLALTTPRLAAPIVGRCAGLGVLSRVIVALVAFDEPDDYATLLRLRESVYTARAVRDMGVVRRSPFVGHVTLGYWESSDAAGLAAALGAARTIYPSSGVGTIRFEITAVGLYRFAHLAHYTPIASFSLLG